MPKPAWEVWEEKVNDRLSLRGTAASGATWKDKGDGSSTNNYEEVWPLMVDAKTTKAASYSIKAKFVEDMHRVAKQDGKTFALPVKFLEGEHDSEWVVVPFEDYAYLVEEHRKGLGRFTVHDIGLVRALSKSVKSSELREMIERVLAKMGVDR